MINYFCDSPIHKVSFKVSSLALAFIVLSFCVLPSFASADPIHPNIPVGYQEGETFRDILLAVLDSWGISFSKSGSDDDISILEYSDQLMQEFYADAQTTQELFWDLVKYGVSQTGEIILDFMGVNKIRQFANWLVDKFSLSNNSSVVVSSSSSWAGQPFAPLVGHYVAGSPQGGNWHVEIVPAFADIYFFTIGDVYYAASERNSYDVINSNAFARVNFYRQNLYGYNSIVNPIYDSDFLVYYSDYGVSYNSGLYYPPSLPSFASITDALDSLRAYLGSSTFTINTLIIAIPSEDFEPDDGLQIEIPGANWGDSIFTILDLFERLIGLYDNTQLEIISIVDTLENLISNLQHSVSVENIPGAVTLDYDDYDIPLENEWGLFDIFFNTGGDEITLLRPWRELRDIIYGFPAPVLSFFALVVLFIVAYGFIRMGRDSH